jgi:hypothetical protein
MSKKLLHSFARRCFHNACSMTVRVYANICLANTVTTFTAIS